MGTHLILHREFSGNRNLTFQQLSFKFGAITQVLKPKALISTMWEAFALMGREGVSCGKTQYSFERVLTQGHNTHNVSPVSVPSYI